MTIEAIPTLAATAATAGHWDGDGPPAFWPIFPILWLLFLAAIATAAIIVVRRNRAQAPRRAGEARLAERFAAGEIDDEEYRARRAVLREKE